MKQPILAEVGWIITDDRKKIYLIFKTLWTIDRYKVEILGSVVQMYRLSVDLYIYMFMHLFDIIQNGFYLVQKNQIFTYI